MTPQEQQALKITQSAVGQLQGMFQRLAGKMEVDVATLKTGLQDVIRAVRQLQQDVQALRAELDRVRTEAPVKAPMLRVVNGKSAPAAPKPERPVAQVERIESEDAEFFASGED